MTNFDELRNLTRLLGEHGVSSTGWTETNRRGFSGARVYSRTSRNGAPYVVKVTSEHEDWIMRATSDHRCREAVVANVVRIDDDRVGSPAVGSTQDGAVFSILMHDISDCLLTDKPLTDGQLDTILRAMARLHSLAPPTEGDVPWCSTRDRLTLFMPDPGKLADFRIADDILRGWELFFRYAPRDVGELVRSLFDDIGPLERALGQLPSRLLHGDLKLDNIGLCPDGALSLIDWSMPMVAPVAIELGWFLAMNSRVLPVSLEEAMAAYTSYATIDRRLREHHESMTVLCGLLLRAWRKALDAASGEPAELLWWCERASSAASTV